MESSTRPRSFAVSNIPSSAVAAAFVPIQRTTNDSIRARQVQSQKNSHHSEDVEELDDTAVNSVHDQDQRRGNSPKDDQEPSDNPTEEHLDIEALKTVAPAIPLSTMPKSPPASSDAAAAHLDISA